MTEKKVFECKHFTAGADYFFKKLSKDHVQEGLVHKHIVTVVQKEIDGDLTWFCKHNAECTAKYLAVERRKVECPYKPEES